MRHRAPWTDQSTGITTNYYIHNHPPSSGTGSEHPVIRRFQRRGLEREGERLGTIVQQYNAGSKTRQIQELLYAKHAEERDLSTAQDIRNEVYSVKRERRSGRNSVQTLVEELEKRDKWISRPIFHEEEPNRLSSMFFAYLPLVEYAKIYCKVYVIDITYNTNSSGMPLFECIAIDACGKSVCVCFDFLPGEEEEDLVQTLKNLQEILGEDIAESSGIFLTDKANAIRNAVAQGLYTIHSSFHQMEANNNSVPSVDCPSLHLAC